MAALPTDGPTGSCLEGLEGSLSGARYNADKLMTTDPNDGRPLLARYRIRDAAAKLTRDELGVRRRGGLWRWRELLPVQRWNHVATLGEGACPLFPAPRLGRSLGLANLMIKAESLNPTGSFKARGMAVAVSRATELGVTRFVTASAGNAAGALVAYAACAGATATVVMPADAPLANQTEVVIQGGNLVLLEGLISDCGKLARLIADRLSTFDVSTLKEPYRVEGKKTMGFEVAEDLEWQLPDVVVYPTGGGTGIVGMWKAFGELEEAGLIKGKRPRMISVQAEGCAPIVRAFGAGDQFAAPWANAETAAAGIRVPSALGDFLVLDVIRKSGGTAVAVDEHAIADMQSFISSRTGIFVGLETAAAGAALPGLMESGAVSRDERVVLFDTGSGFKSSPPMGMEMPQPVSSDPASWEDLIEGLTDRTARLALRAETAK
jgi:threonine synthase